MNGNHAEIFKEMRMIYGEECPSRPTVYKWLERFEGAWDTYKGIQLIERILDVDKRATVRELEERSGIPTSSIHRIIQDEQEMKRVFAGWVTKLLSDQSRFTEIMEKREIFYTA